MKTSRLRLFTLIIFAACGYHTPTMAKDNNVPLPAASYTAAAESGAAVYEIVPQESLILIHAGRAGVMKRLGHDHAVASEDVQGYVELSDDWMTNPSAARADIAFPVRNLTVDKPEFRKRLGLETEPSEKDVAGTYANMLKVLSPDTHPWVTASARIASVEDASPTLAMSIKMNDTTVDIIVPVTLELDSSRLLVSGQTTIKQTDFGLEPFQAAGGLLSVADEMKIDFQFVGLAME